MKIGIIGVGMVGGTIAHGFERIGHDVVKHDIKFDSTTLRDVLPCPIVFICVPTPQNEDGSCDTTLVDEVIEDLQRYQYQGLAVIKSTVVPGTTDRLNATYGVRLAFCPEFLREKTAYTDFIDYHDVCIVGAYHDADYQLVKEAHGRLPRRFARLTPLEAEFSKYFSNVFNALRIVFANEFYDVCKAVGADYTKIKDAVTKRTNIPDFYLECNENLRAFGGHCLPKDTAAFANYVTQLGLGGNGWSLFDYIVASNNQLKQSSEAKGKPE